MPHPPKARHSVMVFAPVLFVALAAPLTALGDHVPALLSPASEAAIAFPVPREAVLTFAWQEAPGVSRYRFTVSTSAALKRPVVQRTVEDSSVSVRGLAPGTYYWRVDSLASNGDTMRTSIIRSFAIKADAP